MSIAVIGAGVGGLSAAIALKQIGCEVTVYERGSAVSDLGAGIVCWPNASFVLGALGVLDEVKIHGGHIQVMRRLDANGECLGELNTQLIDQAMHHPSIAIYRKQLMAILFQRAQCLAIPIHFNHTVSRLTEKVNGRVALTFESQEPTATEDKYSVEAAWVIGADGRMNSIARGYVLGNDSAESEAVNTNAKPVYHGFINWIGRVQLKRNAFVERAVLDYWGVGERFGVVPITDNQAYWAAGYTERYTSEVPQSTGTAEASKKPTSLASMAALSDKFETWPALIREVIQQSDPVSLRKIKVHDLNPIDTWHRGQVLLIGDAAHAPLPTSGQGACQALEDAWHLAECVRRAERLDSPESLDTLFNDFTQRRKQKANGVIQTGRHIARSIFHPSPIYCRQRNAEARHTNYHAMAAGMAKAWGAGLPLSSN